MKNVLIATGFALGAFIVNEKACGASLMREEEDVDYGPLLPEPKEDELITFKDLSKFCVSVINHWENAVISQREVKKYFATAIEEESRKAENQKLNDLIQHLLLEINKRNDAELLRDAGITMKDEHETVWWINLQQMLYRFLHPVVAFNAYKIKEFKDFRKVLDKKLAECGGNTETAEKLKIEICASLLTYCKQENYEPEALRNRLEKMSIVEQLATAYEYLEDKKLEDKKLFTYYFGEPYICWFYGIERSPMHLYNMENVLNTIYPGWRWKKQTLNADEN